MHVDCPVVWTIDEHSMWNRKVVFMNSEIVHKPSGSYGFVDDKSVAEEYVWATSEEAKRQAVSLYLIQSITQRHGGNAQVDFENQSINLDVPDDQKMACVQEIEEKVDMTFH